MEKKAKTICYHTWCDTKFLNSFECANSTLHFYVLVNVLYLVFSTELCDLENTFHHLTGIACNPSNQLPCPVVVLLHGI